MMLDSCRFKHDVKTYIPYKHISRYEGYVQEETFNAALALSTYRSLERASTRSFCCRRPSMSSSAP